MKRDQCCNLWLLGSKGHDKSVEHAAHDRKQIACPHGQADEPLKVLAIFAGRTQEGLDHA